MKRVEHQPKRKDPQVSDDKKHAWLRSLWLRDFGARAGAGTVTRSFFGYLDGHAKLRQSPHYYRYLTTLAVVEPFLDLARIGTVIETGGASPVAEYLAGQCEVFQTETDLRQSLDAEDASADLVLSLEVLEHLKDSPNETFDEMVLFRASGARTYAREIARVLRPGGLLILTTPNTLAAINILRLLEGAPPMVFRPHVREYTRAEIVALFAELDVVHHETCFNFFLMADSGRTALDIIEKAGGVMQDRGDDHVFVFRKPGGPA